MSGIAGIVHRDGQPVHGPELEKMLDAMSWRGPDGRGVWATGSAALGHLLLQVTPESLHERQPIVRGDLAITADARLDNRDELCSHLHLSRPSAELTDAELIMASYERWGEECVDHLLGDFAFAVWDGRRQTIFCARDHFGVRPFVYFLTERTFAFGSQPSALLALSEIPRRIDERFIARFIAAEVVDPAVSVYQNIHRLPAAHTLTIGPSSIRLRRYWTLDPHRGIRLRSDAEYEEAFRDLFFAAVRSRIRTSFPVGSAVSGGLDSSAVTAAARRLLPPDRPLHTFTLIYPDHPQVDERQFASLVYGQEGYVPHLVNGDAVSPFVDLDRQIETQSEPAYAPNLFLHWAMFREARAAGVRVWLDGFDGDTTVSHGLVYLSELFWRGRILAARRESKALATHSGLDVWGRVVGSELHTVRRRVRDAAPSGLVGAYRRARGRQGIAPTGPAAHLALNPELVDRTLLPPSPPRLMRSERVAHRERLIWPLIDTALEVIDRAAAAHGLQAALPFFDVRLAEFCVALPGNQKLRGGWTRSIFRRAMEGILPPEVQWRRDKSNMSPILADALLRDERERMEALVRTEAITPYVDRAALLKIWQRYVQEPNANDVITLWRWAAVGLWLEHEGSAGPARTAGSQQPG